MSTGNTFLISSDCIVRNNLGFEYGRAGYMPNTTSTSESQSLYIRGNIRAYIATGQQSYLLMARKAALAAIKYHYMGLDPRDANGKWYHHWIVNAGRAADAQCKGPQNTINPDYAGYIGTSCTFTNGQINLGDQLANVYGVASSDAVFVWDNVYSELSAGEFLELDFYVDRDGYLMQYVSGSAGDIEFSAPTAAQTEYAPGTVMLKDTTFNGTALVNYSNYIDEYISYGETFECWPMWRQLATGEKTMAADAIHWFLDAFYFLMTYDTDSTYSSLWTAAYQQQLLVWQQACTFDETTYFSKTMANAPYNSYPITYFYIVMEDSSSISSPTDYLEYSRDSNGYVSLVLPYDTSRNYLSWENNSLLFTISGASTITFNLSLSVSSFINVNITSNSILFNTSLYVSTTNEMVSYTINCSECLNLTGISYWTVGNSSFTFGDSSYSNMITTVNNNNYNSCEVYIPNQSSGWGFAVVSGTGGWTNVGPPAISYITNYSNISVIVTDADGWMWYLNLPERTDSTPYYMDWSAYTINPYQTNSGTAPSSPNNSSPIKTIQFQTSNTEIASIAVLNVYSGQPDSFDVNEQYDISLVGIQCALTNSYTMKIGDCYFSDATRKTLNYVPGALPFQYATDVSGEYSGATGTGAPFQGPPHMGYQNPVPWFYLNDMTAATNMLQMISDAQANYTLQSPSGMVGPCTPSYILATWDSIQTGTMDTFVFASPDPNWFWGGFNYRTFNNVADFWQRAFEQNTKDAPLGLCYSICMKYMTMLYNHFMANPNSIRIPDSFYPKEDPILGQDPHGCALALKGAIFSRKAGFNPAMSNFVISQLYNNLTQQYVSTGDMVGSFSTDTADHQFYGFWAGEILDALSLIKMYVPDLNAIWSGVIIGSDNPAYSGE